MVERKKDEDPNPQYLFDCCLRCHKEEESRTDLSSVR